MLPTKAELAPLHLIYAKTQPVNVVFNVPLDVQGECSELQKGRTGVGISRNASKVANPGFLSTGGRTLTGGRERGTERISDLK